MQLQQRGFTLLEVISVLVLVAILATTAVIGSLPSRSFQLQSSRDQVITAFFGAQQHAMVQTFAVQLSISGNQIDVRADTNGDGDFSAEASLRLSGVQYPFSLSANQTITPGNFVFNRLGQTQGATLTLGLSGASIDIQVSDSGFVR